VKNIEKALAETLAIVQTLKKEINSRSGE